MELNTKFQASDYFSITSQLGNKDWILRLTKLFPDGGLINWETTLTLEQVNLIPVEEQKQRMANLVKNLEGQKQKLNVISHSNEESIGVKPLTESQPRKPIQLSF